MKTNKYKFLGFVMVGFVAISLILAGLVNLINPDGLFKAQSSSITESLLSKFCPDNTAYDLVLAVCASKTEVYGIFTKDITTKCGTSNVCTAKVDVMQKGKPIKLQRYGKPYYTSLRGAAKCPIGSTIWSGDNDFCIENMSNGSKEVLGPINEFQIKVCSILFPNINCSINRIEESALNSINARINDIGKAIMSTRTFMYHAFELPNTRTKFLDVNVADFKLQLEWLINNGYTIITSDAIVTAGLEGKLQQLPAKRAILQLDDGYKSVMLARDVASQVSQAKKVKIPLEIGLVRDNINLSAEFLTLLDYKQLIKDGHTIVSHTRTHCSLGDDSKLNYKSGTAKVILGPEVKCPRFAAPNSKYVRPLTYEENIQALSENHDYIRSNFNLYSPIVIFPFGHNSTQNTKIMKLLGYSYGYNTVYQPICRNDLIKEWKDANSNYNILRTTVNGLHKGVEDPSSWFKKASNINCQ
jgi:peptidoglycan/xylan/chitin deacetylase (PgdA/CDA1 family)